MRLLMQFGVELSGILGLDSLKNPLLLLKVLSTLLLLLYLNVLLGHARHVGHQLFKFLFVMEVVLLYLVALLVLLEIDGHDWKIVLVVAPILHVSQSVQFLKLLVRLRPEVRVHEVLAVLSLLALDVLLIHLAPVQELPKINLVVARGLRVQISVGPNVVFKTLQAVIFVSKLPSHLHSVGVRHVLLRLHIKTMSREFGLGGHSSAAIVRSLGQRRHLPCFSTHGEEVFGHGHFWVLRKLKLLLLWFAIISFRVVFQLVIGLNLLKNIFLPVSYLIDLASLLHI